ncbi:hypothetical protein GF402_10275 [Candidatus Fermentibacteria bacterium]|nr:hypothetical protein [Candidatus Fermentibacteria bacterium]
MTRPVSLLALVALVGMSACSLRSGVPDTDTVEEIREELDRTACRNRLDDLAFALRGLVLSDTTGSTDPARLCVLLDDSLLVCPATGGRYLIEEKGDEWVVRCPAGHGSESFEVP